ncbi:class I adenylate-forming enzyme family protein [Parahaliea maris]|uniref:class I adenylate-forming enzyme family protein n=1 Tax=Parahaliea maris TaxID=2716870 RepID=UPI00164F3432|nr:class I adenylate-forming enzyme family protein [Parahaliea maris]
MSESLSEEYYQKGYWSQDDFWTSFTAVADRFPGKVALVDRESEVTFAELKSRAMQFAASASQAGRQPGDIVILHGRHCIEAVVAILGCSLFGLVPALLPAMFSQEQIKRIISHTGASLLFSFGEEKELERARLAVQGEEVTVVVPDDALAGGDALSWTRFLQSGQGIAAPRSEMDPDELMLLIYSSGTTGAPKGVMHSANSARFSVMAYADMHRVTDQDVELVITAFGFVGSSLLGFYLTLLKGCKSVLMRNWCAEEAIALMERYQVTHFLLMPTHAIDILACPALDTINSDCASRAVVAGVAPNYRIDARSRLCGTPFPMYGMSESPAHVTGGMTDDWDNLLTTEGRNLPGTDVLICDENDNPVAVGEQGDILVRGPNRFLGYYRADDLNEMAISPEGYFRTGDIGFFDEKGYMTFVSRSKDIIRRGGVTITPAEIETALRSHPDITDVAVIGLPDPRLGEKACACVITANSHITLEDVTVFLQEKGLARYLWPESLEICNEFPRTPSLKVQKNQLKERVLQARSDSTTTSNQHSQ